MKPSLFRCERCGSSRVRRSQRRTVLHYARMLLGSYQLHCLDCEHRFWVNVLLISKVFHAKCPKCLEMRLDRWDAKHYHVPRWKTLLIRLGARRYRCNRCRFNFVSFRLP
jgi:DNA-directed RNA polymerase subunit RPC12/RpoP